MAFANGPRVFTRTGVEEEEITPPSIAKMRSFDSLSVAHILQAKLDPAAAARHASPLCVSVADATTGAAGGPSSDNGEAPPHDMPSSPSVAGAAAVLQRVQSREGMDQAVDCLMSLATLAGANGAAPAPAKATKPASSGKRSRSAAANDGEGGGGAKRRLKMRAPASSNGGAPTPGGAKGRAQQSRAMARAMAGKGGAAAASPAAAAAAPQLAVAGVAAPITLLSGASLLQLQLLSAAFKLCPEPTAEQITAVGRRVGLPDEKLSTWFSSRRTLEQWVQSTPDLRPSQLANMFYAPKEEHAMPPPPPRPPTAAATVREMAAASLIHMPEAAAVVC